MDMEVEFKKPELIMGRKSKGPGQPVQKEIPITSEFKDPNISLSTLEVQDNSEATPNVSEYGTDIPQKIPQKNQMTTAEKKAKYTAMLSQLKYTVPLQATNFDSKYSLEVLKNGSIIEQITFSPEKSFYVIGRSPGCDIVTEHLTFSRMHAIFQFIGENKKTDTQSQEPLANAESENSEVEPIDLGMGDCKEKGLYLYDLNSTHGTFLNKNKLYPKRYYRLRVGHVVKFGNSSRLFVVTGPSEDEEEESSKTVTELLKERLEKDLERKRQLASLESKEKLIVKNVEEEGIGWGMADDAIEETDLSVNPFSVDFESTEAKFDNPKKTLLGWFEREGYHDELFYDVREKTNGHFICRINLPLDGPSGAPVFAEVDGKGKKKEIVAQCALKACQLLDKYGVLRQSHHEGHKRKLKNWEEKDYYSSDEDTYLDRTGSVEKKRKIRMTKAGKIETKTETYETLAAKYSSIETAIESLNKKISKAESDKLKDDEEIDPLDAFMQHLKTGATDIGKMKKKMKELLEELKQTKKLVDIAAPVIITLPNNPTVSKPPNTSSTEISDISELKTIPTTTIIKTEEIMKNDTKTIDNPIQNKSKFEDPNPKIIDEIKSEQTEDLMDMESETINSDITKKTKALVQDVEKNETEQTLVEPSSKSKRKKNKNRQQQQKLSTQQQVYDSSKPEYSDWVPPTDQRGDGWTKLNEKLGY